VENDVTRLKNFVEVQLVEVARQELETVRAAGRGDVGPLDRRVVIRGKGVNADHRAAFGQEAVGKVRPDKPGHTRDDRAGLLHPPD